MIPLTLSYNSWYKHDMRSGPGCFSCKLFWLIFFSFTRFLFYFSVLSFFKSSKQIILWSCSTACLIQVFIYYIKRLDSTVDSIKLYLPVGRPLKILLNFLQWVIWCCRTYFKLSYKSSKRLFENLNLHPHKSLRHLSGSSFASAASAAIYLRQQVLTQLSSQSTNPVTNPAGSSRRFESLTGN